MLVPAKNYFHGKVVEKWFKPVSFRAALYPMISILYQIGYLLATGYAGALIASDAWGSPKALDG